MDMEDSMHLGTADFPLQGAVADSQRPRFSGHVVGNILAQAARNGQKPSTAHKYCSNCGSGQFLRWTVGFSCE